MSQWDLNGYELTNRIWDSNSAAIIGHTIQIFCARNDESGNGNGFRVYSTRKRKPQSLIQGFTVHERGSRRVLERIITSKWDV
jgi:hypothetical protein